MYDKYQQVIPVSASETKLAKNKGVYLHALTAGTVAGITAYCYSGQTLGATASIVARFSSVTNTDMTYIFPIEVYSIPVIANCTAHLLI
jgi:hypothetical protein